MNRRVPKNAKLNKEDLQALIQNVRENALNLKAQFNASSASMQNVVDVADNLAPLIDYMPENGRRAVAELLSETSRGLDLMNDPAGRISALSATAGGTALMGGVVASGIFNSTKYNHSHTAEFSTGLERLNTLMSQPEYKELVITLLHDFHLDHAHPGKKSPLELFEIAHYAFENPISTNNPTITSLIPMREAIQSTIDELIRLRPTQKPTGSSINKKFKAIFEQLAKDRISETIVQELVDQWQDINDNDLSAAKRHKITREEWIQKLSRATVFLYSLLSYLDVSKLRK